MGQVYVFENDQYPNTPGRGRVRVRRERTGLGRCAPRTMQRDSLISTCLFRVTSSSMQVFLLRKKAHCHRTPEICLHGRATASRHAFLQIAFRLLRNLRCAARDADQIFCAGERPYFVALSWCAPTALPYGVAAHAPACADRHCRP